MDLPRSGEGSALIQGVPARDHEPHTGAKGFRRRSVSAHGCVRRKLAVRLGGRSDDGSAGGDGVILGPGVSDGNAIALLNGLIKRRKCGR